MGNKEELTFPNYCLLLYIAAPRVADVGQNATKARAFTISNVVGDVVPEEVNDNSSLQLAW